MDGKKPNDALRKLVPKGFLESYILSILSEKPLHGYMIMKRIKEKTGFWKPSPGTVYPALHSLVKKGFIKEQREGRKKKYSLTKNGLKIAREVENLENKIKDKATEILSKILDLNKTEIKDFFDELKKKSGKNILLPCLRKTFNLVLKINDKPEKIKKAKEIINETNAKLRNLLK